MKMKQVIKNISLLYLLVIGCSSNLYVDNQKIIAKIDTLPISKIILEVETDSIGHILDTISIERLKYDNKNRKRYKEKKYYREYGFMLGKDYFNADEDLFYRENFNDKAELEAIFETRTNKKGIVYQAIQIFVANEGYDTILMNYSSELYPNGKVKKLLIKTFYEELGEFNSMVEYNESEKPLFEVMVMDKDTTSFQSWEYADTVLLKSIYTNYQADTSRCIYHFGVEKRLIMEEEFNFIDGNYIKAKEINHFYNTSNERKKSIETNLATKEAKYIEYLIHY